jgi:hypothetical protein
LVIGEVANNRVYGIDRTTALFVFLLFIAFTVFSNICRKNDDIACHTLPDEETCSVDSVKAGCFEMYRSAAPLLHELWASRVKMTRLFLDDKLVRKWKQEVRYETEEMAFRNRSFLLPADEYAGDACRIGRSAGRICREKFPHDRCFAGRI